MAAGATVATADLERFSAYLSDNLSPVDCAAVEDFLVDGTLTAAGAQTTLTTALNRAGPFGSGQPEPVFVFPDLNIAWSRRELWAVTGMSALNCGPGTARRLVESRSAQRGRISAKPLPEISANAFMPPGL